MWTIPGRGTYQTVGCPIKLSDSPAEIHRPPTLGEHNEEVLAERNEASFCGLSSFIAFANLVKNVAIGFSLRRRCRNRRI